jgi:hypothetical protein
VSSFRVSVKQQNVNKILSPAVPLLVVVVVVVVVVAVA